MDEDFVLQLLKEGTSETVEICETIKESEIPKHICALANSKGGYLVIGARYLHRPIPGGIKFEPRGVSTPRGLDRRIRGMADSLKPSVSIDYAAILMTQSSNTRVIVISVPRRSGSEQVSAKDGQVYLRFKDETVPAGVGLVPMSRLAVQVRDRLQNLADSDVARIQSEVHERFPESKQMSIIQILLNEHWAEYILDLLESSSVSADNSLEALRQIIIGSRPEQVGLFADANKNAIALTISAIANTSGGHVVAGVRRVADDIRFSGIDQSTVSELDSLSSRFPPGTLTTQRHSLSSGSVVWHAVVQKSSIILPAPDDPLTYMRRVDGTNYRDNLDSRSQASSPELAPESEAPESLVDSSPQAKALRRKIQELFKTLPEEQQLTFVRLRLGSTLQPEWESNFRDRLHYSPAIDLERILGELEHFKNAGGRAHGDVNEYRRDATTDEECLNIEVYIRVLTRFFNSAEKDVCFGLFGHWGRGKTHLMRKVGERLEADHNYRVVRFSAWKYRTNPELWIHLYECIANLARSERLFDAKVAIPVRAAFSRFGLWGLTISLVVLAAALTPMLARFQYAISAIYWLGTGPILYVLLIYTRLRSFAVTLKPYFLIPDHAGKLGLQATIGADLRALLLGWMPQHTWMKSPGIYKLWEHLRKNDKGLESVAYAIIVILVAAQTAYYGGSVLFGVFFSVVWTGLALGLPVYSLLRSSSPHRILLVVDDLDRCESKQMLEIIESIMLLLDDIEVQRRLQVAMLVEEEAVEYAISRKYQHYWKNLEADDRSEKKRALIAENMQKLFLAYLRLGQLNTSEIQEVAERYLQVPRGLANQDNVADASGEEVSERGESVQTLPEGTVFPSDSQAIETSSALDNQRPAGSNLGDAPGDPEQFRFGEAEKHAIIDELQSDRVRNQSRWGPRAIRCFIHKYQLARELLVEIHSSNEVSPRELVEKLLIPESDSGTEPTRLIEHTEYKGAEYVVRQVK